MSEGLISTIIVAIIAPIVTLAIQQFFARRKNQVGYGNDLLDVVNKTAASLKEARAELNAMEQEIRAMEQDRDTEITDLKDASNARIDRMKARIRELESVIVKYDISFTLQTHPQVQVNDLKVVGKEDVMASQRMKAVNRADAEKEKKP